MERLQRLVRSLRTARAAELSSDPKAAVSTLLPLVMKNESKAVSELLLSSDFDVNYRIGGKRTLLHIAANVGAYDCLVILIRKDADVNCQDRSGITPLQLAARNGHVKCIQKLLESKADIEISNCDGMTALHWIASNGRTELLIEILPFVKHIDIEDSNGQTPLHLACLTGHKITVQKLIENGADFEKVDQRGYTPLMYACSHGQAGIVVYLLSIGAKVSNSYDDTSPLQIALENGHKEVCLALVEYDKKLLESLLVLAEQSSIPEEKILGVVKFLARKENHYHHTLLVRLAERSRTSGLELLSASSDFIQTQQRFFKCLSLLCNMVSFSSDDLINRPRSDTVPQSMRSRIDSTGVRVLRTLTSTAPSNVKKFEPPADEMDEILSALWHPLQQWFDLIKNEIHKAPDSYDDSNDTVENADESMDTRLIASELVRSNPIKVNSVRPKSTASLESIRISQPAVEFNMPRQCGDHGINRGLYRDISRRLYQTFNSNQESSSLFHHSTGYNEESSIDSYHAGDDDDDGLRAALNHVSIDDVDHDGNVEEDYLSTFNSNVLEDNDDAPTSNDVENVEDEERQDDDTGRSFMGRSISYRNAMGDSTSQASQSMQGFQLSLSRSFSRSLSIERPVVESSQCSKEDEKCDVKNDKETMVERFADRLCAVLHGYHLVSYTRPYWESLRKFKIRISKFDQFTERNEDVLQLFIARKPKLIFDHFQFVLDNPLVLQRYLPIIHKQPFEERLEWFYENLLKDQQPDRQIAFDEKSLMTISRDSLLLSSCGNVMKKDGDSLKKSLTVQFEGEAGMGEGVVREWFDLLFKEVLNPDYALFTLSADGSTFQPNSNSAVNPDHLNYFLFAGKMMGLAMYHRRLISASFTRSFYKHILGIPVNYQDVASMDPEYAKSLQWILDNDISNFGLEINFAVETREFGETKLVPLKPEGTNILVTEENKEEYVQLAADMKMTRAIKPQIYSFLEGFHEFIPHSLVALFDDYELELVLSGTPEIDCDDWESNTVYQGGISAESQTVRWFWEVVREFNQKDRILLLQFVTGSSRVPWGGFSSLMGASGLQKFTISSTSSDNGLLPSASTCFNLLKLPDYKCKEELSNKLMTALKHGTTGFEFA